MEMDTALKGSGSVAYALAERFTQMQDRADRAEHEASRQREALHLCPIPVLILNKHGYCVYANPRFQEMLGCEYEEALGDNWKNFIHRNEIVEVTHLIEETISSAMEGYHGEHTFLTAAREPVSVYMDLRRVTNGDYIGFFIPTEPGCSAVCLKNRSLVKNGGPDGTRTH